MFACQWELTVKALTWRADIVVEIMCPLTVPYRQWSLCYTYWFWIKDSSLCIELIVLITRPFPQQPFQAAGIWVYTGLSSDSNQAAVACGLGESPMSAAPTWLCCTERSLTFSQAVFIFSRIYTQLYKKAFGSHASYFQETVLQDKGANLLPRSTWRNQMQNKMDWL